MPSSKLNHYLNVSETPIHLADPSVGGMLHNPHDKRKEKTMTRTPIHPGEILADELEETGMSAKKLAGVIEVLPNRYINFWRGRRT